VPTPGLTVRVEPIGVAPGEVSTLTVRLNNPTGMTLTGVSVHAALPDAVRDIPNQPSWAYNAREKRLRAEVGTLTAGANVTLTLALRAVGPADTLSPVTFEAVSGEARATATAEVWIVQPGRARVTPEAGGLLLSPDRRAWVRFPAGGVRGPIEVGWKEVKELPALLPYGLGQAFAVRGLVPTNPLPNAGGRGIRGFQMRGRKGRRIPIQRPLSPGQLSMGDGDAAERPPAPSGPGGPGIRSDSLEGW